MTRINKRETRVRQLVLRWIVLPRSPLMSWQVSPNCDNTQVSGILLPACIYAVNSQFNSSIIRSISPKQLVHPPQPAFGIKRSHIQVIPLNMKRTGYMVTDHL